MDRFWSKVDIRGSCWIWTAAVRNPSEGYGAFWFQGRHVNAHRYAYELMVGKIPAGAVLAHRCDNPRCVRPDHLFVTDQAGNIADKVSKGRQAKGSRIATWKLTPEQIAEIRASNAGACALAAAYGVSRNHIWRLRK
jgi:hypothetical protein